MSEPVWGPRPQESIPLPTDRLLGRVGALAVRGSHNWNDGRSFAGTGDIFPAFVMLVSKAFSTHGVDPLLRGFVFLRISKLLDCPFAWGAQVKMATNAGATRAQIDAIAADGVVTGLGEEADLMVAAAEEVTATGTLTDATLRALRDRYDDELCRKYIFEMSYFNMFCRYNNATRTPLESAGTLAFKVGNRTGPM